MPDEFARRFVERYGHSRLYGVGNFYDSVRLIADRFERAAGTVKPTPEEVLPLFQDLAGFKSVFGALSVDADGIISYPVQCRRVEHGQRKTIPCSDIK